MENKFKNIIKAGAIGDAFGYNVEFSTWEQIKIMYGDGIFFSNCDSYIVSDDTQMTLFLLEALKDNYNKNNSNEDIIKRIYDYFLDWNATQFSDLLPEKEFSQQKLLKKRRAPGNTCLSALGSGRCGSMINKINDSKGCGGIMRVAPIAFLNKSLEDIIYLGCEQAAITHGNPEGYLSSGFFVGLLYLGLKGKSFDESYQMVKDEIKKYKDSEVFINYLEKIEPYYLKEYVSPNEMVKEIGAGWTGETALGLAIYAFKNAKNFEHALVISTNHSGDSDSTASLAGQLYCSFNDVDSNELFVYEKIDIKEIIDNCLINIEIINNFKDVKNEYEVKDKDNSIKKIKRFKWW